MTNAWYQANTMNTQEYTKDFQEKINMKTNRHIATLKDKRDKDMYKQSTEQKIQRANNHCYTEKCKWKWDIFYSNIDKN